MTKPTPHRRILRVEPLTAEAFKPFGEVVEAGAATPHYTINEGYAERYNALAQIDAGLDGGLPILSIFRAMPRVMPFRLSVVERHLLGSQAFVPLAAQRFLVVVATAGPAPRVDALRCFVAAPGQGVNYARGTWHHPLLAIDAGGDFLVIDRSGPGSAEDSEERSLAEDEIWIEG